METLKQTSNNNMNNKITNQQHHRNRSLLKQQRKNKKQHSSISMTKTTTSFVCVVLSLIQAPSGSHALTIQSRARPNMINSNRLRVSTSNSRKTRSTTSTLNYRNYRLHDDGNNKQPQQQHQQANNEIHSSEQSRVINDSSQQRRNKQRANQQQQRQQQQQQQIQHGDHHISNFFHTLLTAGKTRRAKELYAAQLRGQDEEQEKEQYSMDAYLESIDRRYKRLHERSEAEERKSDSNGFSGVLHWLTQSESSSVAEEQRKQEDAIYVLGLADLASTRLLQRHHLPIPASKRNKSVVIDIGVGSDEAKPVSKPTSSSSISVSTKSSSNDISKAAFIVHLLKKTSQVNQLTQKSVRVAGRALAYVLTSFVSLVSDKSGGKQSFQIASVMAAAIFSFALSTGRSLTKA
jgi:hypothetical protein